MIKATAICTKQTLAIAIDNRRKVIWACHLLKQAWLIYILQQMTLSENLQIVSAIFVKKT